MDENAPPIPTDAQLATPPREEVRAPAHVAFWRRPAAFALWVVLGIVLDLWSKAHFFEILQYEDPLRVWPDVLHFSWKENHGVAFSMFEGQKAFIFGVAGLAVGALVWLYSKTWRSGPAVTIIAVAMLLSGAFGNIYDRVVFGHVRDFIDFVPPLPLIGRWAVFNVADIFICVGVGLYLIGELFRKPAATEPRQ